MARPRLTIDDARHLDYKDLTERVYSLMEPFEAPEGMESETELEARISKTLDQLPDIYAWLNQLHAWFDHWTDFYYQQHGRNDLDYKVYREKRDMLEKAASSAKLRYEGTSRRLTQLLGAHDESRMPRSRG